MRRLLVTLMLSFVSLAEVSETAAQTSNAVVCPGGACPLVPPILNGGASRPDPSLLLTATDRAAIVRVTNVRGPVRGAGSGTLVDANQQMGLVITCAHLFREGAGAIEVTFGDRRTFRAKLLRIDAAADLAALEIDAPGIEPVAIAEEYPRRGDPLVSCGYGGNGQLWCNYGRAIGYCTTLGSGGNETLELSGTARFGDSGGPVLDRSHRLVAVLFGTNGRVVDGTFCGRVRQFLAGLSPRFGQPSASPAVVAESAPPRAPVAPPAAPPAEVRPSLDAERAARLEQVLAKLQQTWQGLQSKVDQLIAAHQQAAEPPESEQDAPNVEPNAPVEPPQVEPPSSADDVTIGPIEKVAAPWLSARLAALLISVGVPGGIAGVAAGAIVYLVMRRAKSRLQRKLDHIQTGNTEREVSSSSVESDSQVVERHHNRYVGYELTALDRAWSAAHAHVGEKYPGAVPYLKMVEGVKDQLLSGTSDPKIS